MEIQHGAKVIAFTKVALPFGWLGNMAPFPVTFEAKRYRTTEALFQALRFDDESVREIIRAEKSPMAAKMRAKRWSERRVVVPQSPADVANMKTVLELKLAAHPPLRTLLGQTGDAVIIEDCSKRPHGSGLFWGAAFSNGRWQGDNRLGRLWMELRAAIARNPAHL